jgi:hypothetical protein
MMTLHLLVERLLIFFHLYAEVFLQSRVKTASARMSSYGDTSRFYVMFQPNNGRRDTIADLRLCHFGVRDMSWETNRGDGTRYVYLGTFQEPDFFFKSPYDARAAITKHIILKIVARLFEKPLDQTFAWVVFIPVSAGVSATSEASKLPHSVLNGSWDLLASVPADTDQVLHKVVAQGTVKEIAKKFIDNTCLGGNLVQQLHKFIDEAAQNDVPPECQHQTVAEDKSFLTVPGNPVAKSKKVVKFCADCKFVFSREITQNPAFDPNYKADF